MTVQRYLDAVISYEPETGTHEGVSVMIPLREDAPDTPAVLQDPLPGLPGTWHRETANEHHPARYVCVDARPAR